MIRQSLSAVIRHPGVWIEGMRAALSTARPGRPVPDPVYLAWRRETAYGDPAHPVAEADLLEYLRWRRRQRKLGR